MELDSTRTVQENLNDLYNLKKKLKRKLDTLNNVLKDSKVKLEEAKETEEVRKVQDDLKVLHAQRIKKWFEKFHWFYTSKGKLAIGGRDAQQNDLVYSRYLEDNDLFFHADIQGASAVILKDGLNADEKELEECAQFTASYSKAWVRGFANIDVYCLKKEQVSKHSNAGFVGKGGFALKGERKWFRNTKLELVLFAKEVDNVNIIHLGTDEEIKHKTVIIPGKNKKSEIAKKVAVKFKVDKDDIIQMLPGPSSIKKVK